MSEHTLRDLVTVDVQLPKLTVNFEAMQQALTAEVAKYGDVVVTPETITEARAKATEINATRKVIDRVRKDRRQEALVPIERFDEQMKALTGICDEARGKITRQIEHYDQQRLERCTQLLNTALITAWDAAGVEAKQRRASVTDLAKLGSLTATDNLTRSAQQEIESRAQADRARQEQVRVRLLELENRSHQAGLAAPLTRDHVHQWLEADDATYEAQITRILDAEVRREAQAEARRREQWDQEQARKQAAEATQRAQQQDTRPAEDARAAGDDDAGVSADARPASRAGQAVSNQMQGWAQQQRAHAPPPQVRTDGREGVTITCTFDTAVPPTVTNAELEAELRRKLVNAGITTLTSVRMARKEPA